jgi:hypothetical protein
MGVLIIDVNSELFMHVESYVFAVRVNEKSCFFVSMRIFNNKTKNELKYYIQYSDKRM